MAKKTKKLELSNGLDLSLPRFLNRKDAKVVAVVDAGREKHQAAQREVTDQRAAERAEIKRLALKAKPAKVKAEKKSKVTKPVAKPIKATKGGISPDATLTVLVDSFPHRAGSQAEAKSALLVTGMTVAEYQAAGAGLGLKGNWHLAHIKYCVNYNLIKVEG